MKKSIRTKVDKIIAKSGNEPLRCAYELRCLAIAESDVSSQKTMTTLLAEIALLDKEQAALAWEDIAWVYLYLDNSWMRQFSQKKATELAPGLKKFTTFKKRSSPYFLFNPEDDISDTWGKIVEQITNLYPDQHECSSVLCAYALAVHCNNPEVAKTIANIAIQYDREVGAQFYAILTTQAVINEEYNLAKEMAVKMIHAYPDASPEHLVWDVYDRLPADQCFFLTEHPVFKNWNMKPTFKFANPFEVIINAYKPNLVFSEDMVSLFKQLLDLDVGIHLSVALSSFIRTIEQMDLKGINFVGLMVDGQLITRELLEQHKISTQGILFTKNDVAALDDSIRSEVILTRFNFRAKQLNEVVEANGYFDSRSLDYAALKGDMVLLNKLLAANPLKKMGETSPVKIASSNGNIDIVKLLLTHFTYSKESLNEAVKAATTTKRTDIVTLLKSTPLHDAINSNDLEAVKALANEITVNRKNLEGQSPLFCASNRIIRASKAVEIRCQIVDELLMHTVSREDIYDALCLQCNVEQCYSLAAQVSLLTAWKKQEGHADYMVQDKFSNQVFVWYHTILYKALRADDPVKILSLFEECGADLNYRRDNSHHTLLTGTLSILSQGYQKENFINVLNFLFSRKVDLNVDDEKGNTPLHIYTKDSTLFIIEQLVQHGADLTCKNKAGQTALDVAVQRKASQEIIKLLTPPGIASQEAPATELNKHLFFQEKVKTEIDNKESLEEKNDGMDFS